MKFKLKERMAQNRQIAYTAIGVSLSILLLSFSYVLPFSSIIMMIFVPILSCLIVFNTNWKYQLMYLGIISLVCFIDIQEGFFYLLPNTIIGLFYGNLIKKKISIDMLFLLTVILSTFLNSISYFPIKLFFKVDMIDVYRLIFKMDRSEFVNIYPVFCYFISMIETFFLILISEEELKRRKNKKYELKKALKGCTYGDVNDKKYVKELIFDLLAKEYGVTETNISKAIPFDIPSLLTAQDKFDILIYAYKKEFGYEALTEMIKKYDLAELKFLEGETKPSYVITEDEISEIYEKENISLSFADKLAVVVQRIYQHYKGYSSIDEVRDMNIDGVSGRSIWTSRELFKSGCTN